MTVVVSVTPTAVARDSRTFKQAASIARMGMRSIVVEFGTSPPETGKESFELVSNPDGAYARPVPVDTAEPPGAAEPAAVPDAGELELNIAGRARVKVLRGFRPLASPAAILRRNLSANLAIPPADIFVAHSWGRLPAVWSAARRNAAPLVYDAHDSYFERYPDGQDPYSPFNRWLYATIEGAFARRAAQFVTSSEGIADLLEERIRRRPEVILNYPDTRLDRGGAGNVREAIGASPDDFVLVSVGNDKPGMDVLAGIEAALLLPARFRLVLIGGGMESYRKAIRERGLDGRVHLMPPVPPDEVHSFIRTADAGVILYYGITRDFDVAVPNRLFHAVAAGLPLLYPDLPGIGGVAREHGLGLPIDSRSPESIASAAMALTKTGRLDPLKRAATLARELLTWERQEPLLEQVIRRALEDGRPGR